jgi:hypothetical protein
VDLEVLRHGKDRLLLNRQMNALRVRNRRSALGSRERKDTEAKEESGEGKMEIARRKGCNSCLCVRVYGLHSDLVSTTLSPSTSPERRGTIDSAICSV